MKKALIIGIIALIVAVLAIGAFSTTASAATSGYYTYIVENDEATITDVNTSISGDITIPSKLGSYPVTKIGEEAFYYCSSLTSIVIPDSVTSIGNNAFYGCSGITNVVIPESITSIGNYAFYGCSSIGSVYITDLAAWCNIDFGHSGANPFWYADKLYINNNLVTELIIPDGVSSIRNYAFDGFYKFTNVVIPNSVTSIGNYSFRNCSKLTNIEIPNSVETIGEYAFTGCSGLTSVVLPDSITSIGGSAFLRCSGLTSVVLPDSVTYIGSSAFYECTNLTSVVLPNSITSINGWVFYGCSSLRSIVIPNSVTSIGEKAFYKSSLTSIEIPDTVTSIGKAAFSYCNNLKSVVFGNGVTSIGNDAFSYCNNLTSVVIPDSVTSIGYCAFNKCDSLTKIYYTGTETEWNKISTNSYDTNLNNIARVYNFFGKDENFIFLKDENGVSIGELIDKTTETVAIPSEFNGYSVTNIGEKAFYNCNNLTSVVIPDSVTSIGNYSFCNCSKLTNIEIPNSVATIGYTAFHNCTDLETVYYEGSEEEWNKITIGTQNAPLLNSNIKYHTPRYYTYTISNGEATITDVDTSISGDITIPSTLDGCPVTAIGGWAFDGCSNLTSVTIPNSVKSIGTAAFAYCSGLVSVTIPDSVTYIGDAAFAYCTGLTNITIPNSVTTIPIGMFQNCSGLTTINIPNSIITVSEGAFYGCTKLEKVNYNGTRTEWNKIIIGPNNTALVNADIVFVQKDPIAEAISGTTLTTGVVDGETVIIVPSNNNIAMTESELAAIFNDESITITSNNGIIGTGCKVTIGEYVVDLVVKGDIDGDGVATVFDALMVKKALANNGFANEALREFAGDVDGVDGTTETDVSAILSYIVGKSFINNSESIELAACYSGNSISDTSLSVITLTYLNENKYDVAIRSYTSQFTGNAREPIVVNGITYSYLGGGSTPDAEYTINNDNTITFTIPGFFTATYELQQNNLHRISYDGNDFFPEVFEVA